MNLSTGTVANAAAWGVIVLLVWRSFPAAPALELPTSSVLLPAAILFWRRLCRAEERCVVEQQASAP